MIINRENVETRSPASARETDDVGRLASESGWALGLFLRVAGNDPRKVAPLADPASGAELDRAKPHTDGSSCDSDLWVG